MSHSLYLNLRIDFFGGLLLYNLYHIYTWDFSFEVHNDVLLSKVWDLIQQMSSFHGKACQNYRTRTQSSNLNSITSLFQTIIFIVLVEFHHKLNNTLKTCNAPQNKQREHDMAFYSVASSYNKDSSFHHFILMTLRFCKFSYFWNLAMTS